MTSVRALLVGISDAVVADLEQEGISADSVESVEQATERLASGSTPHCVVGAVEDRDYPDLELPAAVHEHDDALPVVLVGEVPLGDVAEQVLAVDVESYVSGSVEDSPSKLRDAIEGAAATYLQRLDRIRVHAEHPDPGCVIRDGDVVAAGAGIAELLGVDAPESLTDRSLLEAVTTADHDDLEAALSAVGTETTELWVAPASDDRRTVELRFHRSDVDDAIVVRAADVTETARQREATEEAAAQLDAILHNVPMSIYFKDELGRHERVSDFITHTDPEDYIMNDEGKVHPHADDVVGKTDFDLYGPEFAAETYEDDMTVIEDEERVVNRIESGTTSLGEPLYTSTTKVPRYDDGEVVGLVGVTIDVTERVTHREELERQNERLNEFAEVLTHDLRNPLNIANGYLDVLARTYDQDAVEEIEGALGRMEGLIDEIRAFVLEGRLVEEPEAVDLRSATEEAWSTVETGAATLEIDGDLALKADRARLRRLLENLFRNAVEHGSTSPRSSEAHEDADEHSSSSPPSTSSREDAAGASSDEPSVATAPEDAVEHGRSGERGSSLTIRVVAGEHEFVVEDDGVGIPDDVLDDVFERGYSTSEDGTGFGLAIVQSIAQAHGWTVAAEESDEGGARFVFTDVVRADIDLGRTIS